MASPSDAAFDPKPRAFHEDWLVVAVGIIALVLAASAVRIAPDTQDSRNKPTVVNRAKGWIAKLEKWESNPSYALFAKSKSGEPIFLGPSLIATWTLVGLLILPLAIYHRTSLGLFLTGYTALFLLACLAFLMASQATVKDYNFEYVLWALVLGLVISNTIGVPDWMRPMTMGDSFIKLGLVLLGAEILFGNLVALGIPGIFTSWLVTPVVLVTTFWFGQRILKIESPSLNMVISADMSVCGVSAAIATGAACRAKREEVSYAIGVSLLFTAVMMIVQPYVVLWTGMDRIVGAAWMGGTIDSTGAVAAAGSILGGDAEKVATTVKMIQNILIGVIALAVAAYWAARYGPDEHASKVGLAEIWKRFPKFLLGFLGASLAFSFLPIGTHAGGILAETIGKEITTPIRVWLFCLAFVAFGLETNFRSLWKTLAGGKPLLLYVVGQAWSLILSLAMAYLMFGVLYGEKIKAILAK